MTDLNIVETKSPQVTPDSPGVVSVPSTELPPVNAERQTFDPSSEVSDNDLVVQKQEASVSTDISATPVNQSEEGTIISIGYPPNDSNGASIVVGKSVNKPIPVGV